MEYTVWDSQNLDIAIGYGDNQPAPTWAVPFDPTGSHFSLDVTYRGTTQTYTSDAGDLVVSGPTKTVLWSVTSAETSAMVPGGYYRYVLRRKDPGGETRIYAAGRLDITQYPVTPSVTSIVTAGPQGQQGNQGQTGLQGPPSYGFGFATYADGQYTLNNPQILLAGQTTQIGLDGLGPSTDATHLAAPFTGFNFLNNNRFYPRGSYDAYILRLNFTARSATINNVIEVSADIGGSVGAVFDERELFGTEAGQECPFSFPIPVHVKSTFVANGCQFLVTPASTITLWGATLEILPISVGSS